MLDESPHLQPLEPVTPELELAGGPAPGAAVPAVVPERKLTRKMRQFVVEYMKDFCATQAAIRAGYSARTAGAAACLMLKNMPQVRAAIAEALAERKAREGEERERLIRAIEASAYADIRELLNPDGSCKSALELDDATAAAVESLDVQETVVTDQDGKRVVDRHTRIRLVDRTAARNQLAEILGLTGKGRLVGLQFNAPVQVNVNLPADPVAASLAYSRIINGNAS